MDARLVQEIITSLHDGSKHADLAVTCGNPSTFPVLKIVWGGWDNICGPMIQYSWEILPEGGNVPPLHDDQGETAGKQFAKAIVHAVDEPGPSSRPDFFAIDIRSEKMKGSDSVLSRAVLQALSSELCTMASAAKLALKSVKFKLFAVDKLTVLSFIFSAKHKQAETLQLLSFLVPSSHCDWFLRVVPVLKNLVFDVVLKIRGWAFVETLDGTVYNLTQCWVSLIGVIDAMLSGRLPGPEKLIADSLYASPNLSRKEAANRFLADSINASLQSKGHTIVFGSDAHAVNKMICTLALLLPAEERSLCCLCYETPCERDEIVAGCPYLKVRGMVPDRQSPFRSQALLNPALLKLAHPTAVIDVDRRTVKLPSRPANAAQWAAAAARATEAEISAVMGIPSAPGASEGMEPVALLLHHGFLKHFREYKALDGSKSEIVAELLTQVDLLPYDSETRAGYFPFFHRYLKKRAEFFLSVFFDKRRRHPDLSASAAGKQARQVAKLQTDSDYAIILAEVERSRPGFSRTLYR